jgi:hypothetical protein
MTDTLVTLQLRLPHLDQAATQGWLDDLTRYLSCRPSPRPRIEVQIVSETERANDGLTVLRVEHRHGDDLSLHPTYAAAKADLVDYVWTWWSRELPDDPEPDDDDEAIAWYFDRLEDEGYCIEPVTVGPAPGRQPGAPSRPRCQACGRPLTELWLHIWSRASSCDPGIPDGPTATPTWQPPTCRRCQAPLSAGGTCDDPGCPYADRQQYELVVED